MRTLQTIQKRQNLNIVNAVDEIGPGGANHLYAIIPVEDIETDGKNTAYNLIQMQCGPRNENGSTHGIIDSVERCTIFGGSFNLNLAQQLLFFIIILLFCY